MVTKKKLLREILEYGMPKQEHYFVAVQIKSKNFGQASRLISIAQLNVLPHLHLRPIDLVVYKEPLALSGGYLILKGASYLDAFSTYPCRT